MTKPVTGVAILMLVEEGKVRLTDPVSRFIPEFKDTQVAIAKPGPEGAAPSGGGRGRGRGAAPEEITLTPATRAITVRDLLTHTAGLGSGGAGTRETNRVAPRNPSETLAIHIPKLGAAPLDFQPGSQWAYSGLAGIEVLGRIVEVASGLTFDQFLRQRIFDPLGMKDTAFFPTGRPDASGREPLPPYARGDARQRRDPVLAGDEVVFLRRGRTVVDG